jgi:hypothetical protein
VVLLLLVLTPVVLLLLVLTPVVLLLLVLRPVVLLLLVLRPVVLRPVVPLLLVLDVPDVTVSVAVKLVDGTVTTAGKAGGAADNPPGGRPTGTEFPSPAPADGLAVASDETPVDVSACVDPLPDAGADCRPVTFCDSITIPATEVFAEVTFFCQT